MNRYKGYLIFALFFCFFLWSLSPTVSVGDSGELISASYNLGIPHPPGYPLYILIGKAFTFIFLGNIALRVNLLSAFFAALTAVMIYFATDEFIRRIYFDYPGKTKKLAEKREIYSANSDPLQFECLCFLPAIFSSAIIGISLTFWSNSIVAEVYALNAFVVSLFFLIVLKLGKDIKIRSLSLMAFLFGLGLGNHHTLLLIVPFLIFSIFPSVRPVLQFSEVFKKATAVSFFFILGLSTYLYLPLIASKNPLPNWGNPGNIRNFLDVLMRKGYEAQDLIRTLEILIRQLKSFDLVSEFGYGGFILGIFGAVKLWKFGRRWFLAVMSGVLCFSYVVILLVGAFEGELQVLLPFYISAYLFCAVVAGIGVAYLVEVLRKRMKTWLALTVSAGLVITILSLNFASHVKLVDASDDFLAYNYGTNKLKSFEEGALYLPKADTDGFSVWYLQAVEKYREDIEVVPVHFLNQNWYLMAEAIGRAGQSIHQSRFLMGDQRLAIINAILMETYKKNKAAYAGFIDSRFIPPGIRTVSNGLSFKLTRDGHDDLPNVWDYYRLKGIEPIRSGMDYLRRGVLEDYASSYYNLGLYFHEAGRLDDAMNAYEKTLEIDSDDADALNNLSLIYAEKEVNLERAISMAQKAIDLYKNERDKLNTTDTLGWVYYKMQRYEEAFAALSAADRALGGDSDHNYHFGMVLFKLGRLDDARESLSRAMDGVEGATRDEVMDILNQIDSIKGQPEA